jgi:hypothetical protein
MQECQPHYTTALRTKRLVRLPDVIDFVKYVAAAIRHDLDIRTCPTKALDYNPKQHVHAKQNIF